MKFQFHAKIYTVGINWCVDVPGEITNQMQANKGYIKVKGQINGYDFGKNLVPVKNGSYRLFVDRQMMKGGQTAVGRVAVFMIEQDDSKEVADYQVPQFLEDALRHEKLWEDWEGLTAYRRKEVLKYLCQIKREKTLEKNLAKLLRQLKGGVKNVRIP